MPLSYTQCPTTLEIRDDALERDGSVYVARLATPLSIRTGVVTLASGLDDAYATLEIDERFESFCREIEEAVVQTCCERKGTWFHSDASDDDIRAHLRSFVEPGRLRVRVSEDVDCFDAESARIDPPPAGTSVRAVLDASRITCGRTEYGLVWTLTQCKLPRTCLVPDDDEPHEPHEPQNHGLLAHDVDGLDDVIA